MRWIRPRSSRRPIIGASSPTSTTSFARSRSTPDELIGQDHRIVNSGYHPKDFMRDLWRTIAGRSGGARSGTAPRTDRSIGSIRPSCRSSTAGEPRQYLAIRYDITARKHAEAQLREQAALTQLGQLAAVVAHEVRNPLAGLRASLQVIDRGPGRATGAIAAMIQRIDGLERQGRRSVALCATETAPLATGRRGRANPRGGRQRRRGDRSSATLHSGRCRLGQGAGRSGHAACGAPQSHAERLSGRRPRARQHRKHASKTARAA